MAHDGIIKFIELQNNDKLVSRAEDKLIKVWDRNNYKLLRSLEGYYSKVTVLKYHEMSRVLVSGGEDSIIIVWKHVPTLQKVYVLKDMKIEFQVSLLRMKEHQQAVEKIGN